MRLVSYRAADAERLGVQHGERVVAATDVRPDAPPTMAALLAGLPGSLEQLRAAVTASPLPPDAGVALDEVELLPPVPRPGKVIAIGVNYASHASEGGREPPAAPVVFAKFATSLVGHRAEVRWDPALTQAVDAEAELAVVIGRTARRVPAAEALDCVLGYSCLNDVSARDLQYADRQFVRSKSLDTFGPFGPALVTADEVGDPQALRIRGYVNGELRQEASTAEMIFGVAELVAFCSRAFTLEPGDVIATGTPAGVGWFREPKLLLADGDEMVVEIERVGRLVNTCREVYS
ncbi:MAG TPA: fumarylacetoacetate hydrolase family protein [Candidatus Limnocylindrales bacterium]